ncbi:MAG TPA: hypothetical protein VGL91_19005, partial [Acidobacteriota bacterium]
GAPHGGFRFPILNLLDGRTFEQFQLDVGVGDPVLDEPEIITGPPILEFAGIDPPKVPCYPLPDFCFIRPGARFARSHF